MMNMNRLNKIDRRTKEYKDAVEALKGSYSYVVGQPEEVKEEVKPKSKSKISNEEFEFLQNLNGVFPRKKVDWLFSKYEKVMGVSFNKREITPYKINKMVNNLIDLYKKENE